MFSCLWTVLFDSLSCSSGSTYKRDRVTLLSLRLAHFAQHNTLQPSLPPRSVLYEPLPCCYGSAALGRGVPRHSWPAAEETAPGPGSAVTGTGCVRGWQSQQARISKDKSEAPSEGILRCPQSVLKARQHLRAILSLNTSPTFRVCQPSRLSLKFYGDPERDSRLSFSTAGLKTKQGWRGRRSLPRSFANLW